MAYSDSNSLIQADCLWSTTKRSTTLNTPNSIRLENFSIISTIMTGEVKLVWYSAYTRISAPQN